MLYIPGHPDIETSREIDALLSQTCIETTPDGFGYFVTDPEVTMGLTTGTVTRGPEESELTLIINGNVGPEDRQRIASIALQAEEHANTDRYWLARALHAVLYWKTDEDFAERNSTIGLMLNSIHSQIQNIRNNPAIEPRVRAQLDLEAKSALGVLATLRGVSETGQDVFTEFSRQGLWLPHVDSDQVELAGIMQTRKGQEVAGFKLMDEKSERHNCACCGAQLIRGMTRLTLGLDQHDGYSDHHHYHIPCFVDSVLPRFKLDTIHERPVILG